MKKYFTLLIVICFAGGIWSFIKLEKRVIIEEDAIQRASQVEYMKKIKKQQESYVKQKDSLMNTLRKSEDRQVEMRRKISEAEKKQIDLRQDQLIHSMKNTRDSRIDACYKYHSRYKTTVDEMRDCIKRQSKYEFK